MRRKRHLALAVSLLFLLMTGYLGLSLWSIRYQQRVISNCITHLQ